MFGCIGHVHILDKIRQKLDDKSIECVFLGLIRESKVYRMYDPVSKKIIISKDVVFKEDKKWEWSETTKEISSMGLEWGDEDKPQEHEAGHVHEKEEQVDNDTTGSSLSSCEEIENDPSYLVQWRVRKP